MQPLGPSKLCLSCHDGTVALDSFGGLSGSVSITGDARIGTDLSDDHPISIKWNHRTTSYETCQDCRYTAPNAVILPFFETGGNSNLECTTCHDVHNAAGNEHLLRKTSTGSELCFHCHGM